MTKTMALGLSLTTSNNSPYNAAFQTVSIIQSLAVILRRPLKVGAQSRPHGETQKLQKELLFQRRKTDKALASQTRKEWKKLSKAMKSER